MNMRLKIPWSASTDGGPLGRSVNHDPRSRLYRVSGDSSRTTVQWARDVPVLDQGDLGSCTGNAGTGALGTTPNYVGTAMTDTLDEKFAVQLYSDATKVDSDPQNYPPTDTGSDGLSVAKVLLARGLVSGYQHAFGIDDAFAAIKQGPLMVGSYWLSGMDTPDADGLVQVKGKVRGGHEYECVGYDAASDLWHLVNSWGNSWGKAGHFYYSTAGFTTLLKQQGDVVLLTPSTQPAPTPTPVPADVDEALWAKVQPWTARKHVGLAGAVSDELVAWAKAKAFTA